MHYDFLFGQEEISTIDTITEQQKQAIMKLEKLHITFGVMTLPNDESRVRAKQLLSDCHEKIFK